MALDVKSFLVKQPGQHQYIVLDTVVNAKHIACSLGIGVLSSGEARLTQVGQDALNALMSYSQNFQSNEVLLVEIKSQLKAKERIPLALINAKPNSTVYFICKDNKVYDYVFSLLGFQQYSPFEASSH